MVLELDLGSTNDQAIALKGNFSREESMDGVVLELVRSILRCQEGIVDSNDGCFRVLQGGTAHKTSDTSKSIDSKFQNHF